MPPTIKHGPSGGGTPAARPAWVMPQPPATVLWRNAPGGETAYAIVTKYNKHSVNLAVFAPDSRVVIPKDGVRFVDDPWNKTNGINADSGVWDYTEEHKQFVDELRSLGDAVSALIESADQALKLKPAK